MGARRGRGEGWGRGGRARGPRGGRRGRAGAQGAGGCCLRGRLPTPCACRRRRRGASGRRGAAGGWGDAAAGSARAAGPPPAWPAGPWSPGPSRRLPGGVGGVGGDSAPPDRGARKSSRRGLGEPGYPPKGGVCELGPYADELGQAWVVPGGGGGVLGRGCGWAECGD